MIVGFASRQNGRVGRWQLLGAGVSRKVIEGRIRCGLLIPIFPGVYAVGHRDRGNLGAWSAAVLLGGPAALLSHRAASGLRTLLPGPAMYADVTLARDRAPNTRVRWHVSAVPPDECEVIDDIPVTSLNRTLIDIAPLVSDDEMDQALEVVWQNGLTDPLPLGVMIERHRGRRGIARLRRALEHQGGGGVRKKELERRFWRFVGREGIPPPKTNVQIEIPGEFVTPDCVWLEQRLVVELDSKAFHLDPAAFEVDRERDAALVVAGWRVIRITWKRLHADSANLAAQILSILDA
ncbi:DUF559 domain-containing protein [soil metagenome]